MELVEEPPRRPVLEDEARRLRGIPPRSLSGAPGRREHEDGRGADHRHGRSEPQPGDPPERAIDRHAHGAHDHEAEHREVPDVAEREEPEAEDEQHVGGAAPDRDDGDDRGERHRDEVPAVLRREHRCVLADDGVHLVLRGGQREDEPVPASRRDDHGEHRRSERRHDAEPALAVGDDCVDGVAADDEQEDERGGVEERQREAQDREREEPATLERVERRAHRQVQHALRPVAEAVRGEDGERPEDDERGVPGGAAPHRGGRDEEERGRGDGRVHDGQRPPSAPALDEVDEDSEAPLVEPALRAKVRVDVEVCDRHAPGPHRLAADDEVPPEVPVDHLGEEREREQQERAAHEHPRTVAHRGN